MNICGLIPWGRSHDQAPAPYRGEDHNPFLSLRRDMDRLFDDDMLTLRDERRAEVEDRDRKFSERFYGRLERPSRSASRSRRTASARGCGMACCRRARGPRRRSAASRSGGRSIERRAAAVVAGPSFRGRVEP